MFWCELLSFEDISYRVFCFLSSRMELVGNLLVVFKVPKNIHLLLRGDTFFSMYSWRFKLSWVCQSESATSADFSIFHIFRWINSTVGKSKKFGMKCPFNVTMSEIQRYTYQCIVFVYPYSNRIGVWAQTGLTVWIFKLFRCSNEPLTVEIQSDSTSIHCLKNECQSQLGWGLLDTLVVKCLYQNIYALITVMIIIKTYWHWPETRGVLSVSEFDTNTHRDLPTVHHTCKMQINGKI